MLARPQFTVEGYGLGMVAAAIIVGCRHCVWASAYGVKLELDNFTKSLFYYLFMYGVGLRVGPSFVNSLGRRRAEVHHAGVVSCRRRPCARRASASKLLGPAGRRGRRHPGRLADHVGGHRLRRGGGQRRASYKLPEGTTPEQVSSMIALSYGITYIWGTVGHHPHHQVSAASGGASTPAQAAKEYEASSASPTSTMPTLTGWTAGRRCAPTGSRTATGPARPVCAVPQANPEYRVVNVVRDGERLGAPMATLRLQLGDIIALGGRREKMTEKMGLIGPEVSDSHGARTFRWTSAEILVTNKDMLKLTQEELRALPDCRPDPGRQARARRRADSDRHQHQAAAHGHVVRRRPEGRGDQGRRRCSVSVVRPSTATDLLTLSVGMILGFLIGAIQFPAFGASVGLGNAGGLLVSGVIVSSLVSRLRFFGNTPNAARNILEDLGLVVFVAIVGINSGNALLTQLTGVLARQDLPGGLHRLFDPAVHRLGIWATTCSR